jgi:prolyl-tRNA synthetase
MLDIAETQPGHGCHKCGTGLDSMRGIEVGHIFKLGTLFSQKMEAFYLDQQGEQKPIVMGCYGIGVGRILAAAVEQNHDDNGIIWTPPISPYQVYLCALGMENHEVAEAAERLYTDLEEAGLDVLFDDRSESPGVKFNDADLLGIPLRVVVSSRNLKAQSVEVKGRTEKESQLIPLEEAVEAVRKLLLP